MQTTLTKHPRDRIKELWRVQASQNITDHGALCEIDDITIESTRAAMMHQLVNFEAVNKL